MPEAAPLAALRECVDQTPQRLNRVLMDPLIRKEIFGGVKNDEKKVKQAFVSQNSEYALKTKPRVSPRKARETFFPASVNSHHLRYALGVFSSSDCSRGICQLLRHSSHSRLTLWYPTYLIRCFPRSVKFAQDSYHLPCMLDR